MNITCHSGVGDDLYNAFVKVLDTLKSSVIELTLLRNNNCLFE